MNARFIILLLCFCSCSHLHKNYKFTTDSFNDIFLQEVRDSTKTSKQILENLLPNSFQLASKNNTRFYYGNNTIEEDSLFRHLLVGKFINNELIIAIELNWQDTIVNFYKLDNETWNLIGCENIDIPIYKFSFEELNGDTNNEIVASTAHNMNGNTWQSVYSYSKKTNTIKYAGTFSTDFVIKRHRKQIQETYGGSWYMDYSKTLYKWQQEKLIPIKQISITHDTLDQEKLFISYYQNKTKSHGLQLLFSEPYYDNNKEQQRLWDNFFKKQWIFKRKVRHYFEQKHH